ncbi:MAG: repeat-associated core domain protein [Acidobacteriales bacterium]|nr:repeat-associated core domain protein [Terriglobales bacterium]
MNILKSALRTFIVVSALLGIAAAQQVNDGNQTGYPYFGSFHGTDQENVSVQNGNLHFEIPLLSVPQRGGRNFNFSFVYDTPTWQVLWYPPEMQGQLGYWTVNLGPDSGEDSLWRVVGPTTWGITNEMTTETCSYFGWNGTTYADSTVRQNWNVIDPSGTKHPVPLRTATIPNCNGPGQHGQQLTGYATDGSGIYVDVTQLDTPTVLLKDGTRVQPWKDTNGNTASDTSDMLGRNLLPMTYYGSNYVLYSYTDATGTAQSYRIDYATFNYQTDFCHGTGITSTNCYEASGQQQLPIKLTGPNNLVYQFHWQDNGSLDLQKVDLPTGGSISYTYSSINKVTPHVIGNARRAVSTRTVNDGTDHVWTYSGVGIEVGDTRITDPLSNYEVHTFSQWNGHLRTSFETMVRYYDSSNNLLRTIQKDYLAEQDPTGGTPPINLRQIRQTTTLDGGLVSKSETDYETFASSYIGTSYTTTRLNPTENREYDFGQGAAGAMLRKTAKTYVHNANSSYLAANIADRVLSNAVSDGTSTLVAWTTFGYDDTAISPSGITTAHDSSYNTSYMTRGNVTKVNRWLNTTGALLTTTNTYDDLGNLKSISDPLGHQTQFFYSSAFAGAYLTQTQNALGHITSANYNFYTGLPISATDANQNTTTFAYDYMLNRISTTFPDTMAGVQGNLSVDYHGYSLPFKITTTRRANPNPAIVSNVNLDMLGRASVAEQCEDGPACTQKIKSVKTYDALGRISTVSNPYRSTSDTTYGLTTTTYDALGRVVYVIKPDGSSEYNEYAGNWHTQYDELRKPRSFKTDALNRLALVYEPDPATGAWAYGTSYAYDTLNNVTTVQQDGGAPSTARWRYFSYDSLSRLLSANNPETGTISYAYDADGNLAGKTDARNITTTFGYDALHRLKQKTYTDTTLPAFYYYDEVAQNIGRLTSIGTWGSGGWATAANYRYDAMGRVTTQIDYCVPFSYSCYYSTTAEYNLAGGLNTLTYPSGRKITDSYDAAGRLGTVTFTSFGASAISNYNYYVASTFTPAGSAQNWTLGNTVGEAATLNNRLQPNSYGIAYADATGTYAWMNRNYGYWNGSDPCAIKQNTATSNNGNIVLVIDNLNAGRTQSFCYDNLNRITGAWSGAGSGSDAWGQSFTYDPWGNLTQQTAWKGTPPNFSAAVNPNNRLVGYGYDAAGNMTADLGHTYIYDAESQITGIDSNATTYIYDANGERVRKTTGSNFTEYVYFGGQPIAEKNQAGDWSDYIFAGGKRVAKADSFQDRLHIHGINACSTTCYSGFPLSSIPGVGGYTIRSGDKLYLNQYGAQGYGGIYLGFNDGTNAAGMLADQDQQSSVSDGFQNVWHKRTISLAPVIGKTINGVTFTSWTSTPTGGWDIYFEDVAIISLDGSVHPIYSREPSSPFGSPWATAGISGLVSEVQHVPDTSASDTTVYYHGDHLGSARMLTSPAGWPLSQGTFLPFGYEYNLQTSTNHYKFTGKERDSETLNDYFGARYYNSSSGRWLTPDWSASPVPVPYANLSDPQSLNLYGYVRNLPISHTDVDGHCPDGMDVCFMPKLAQDANYLKGYQMGAAAGLGLLGAGGVAAGFSELGPLATGLYAAFLGTSHVTTPIVVDTLEGLVPGRSGTLTISSTTSLTANEIRTGVKFASQSGKALVQSEHVGAEFVDAAGKTYDAMGGGKAFEHFKDGSQFFNSILHHVNKSVDQVVIDLAGASKQQIGAVKDFVKTLTKEQQAKVVYVN